MVVLYYLIIYGYIFLDIILVDKLFKNNDNEIKRKITHILLFIVWILLDIFFKNTIHQVIIPFTFIIINYLSYKYKIFKSIEREDNNHLGIVYFSIAVFIVMLISYILPEYYIYSGIAVFCLTFGDGFAALIGYLTKSIKIKGSKSLNGFIACFVFSFISLLIINYLYVIKLSIVTLIIISLLAAIFELVGKGLDNFSVTIGTFLYCILLHINKGNNLLNIVTLITISIFLIVFFSKAITYYGSLFAMLIVFIFGFLGSIKALIFLLVSYFISFIISFVRKKIIKINKEKSERRNIKQIFVNGICGSISIIIYNLTNDKLFMILAIICIGGCLIDSISSDIGSLSKTMPIDIIGFKKMKNNVSGGITILGTTSALVAAILLGILAGILFKIKIIKIFIISLLIFSQTIIDSILGSTLQVKYKCLACGEIIEEKFHCQIETKIYKGYKFINNNIVNLVSSIITFVISIFVLGCV